MKSAACCRVLCLEGGTTSETVVSSANFHTLLGDEDRLSLLEIAMDPNRSPEALQQEPPTNQKTLHSLSASAVCPLESRLSCSQLKVSRQDLEA